MAQTQFGIVLEYFPGDEIGIWLTQFGIVLEYFRSLQKKRRIGKVRREVKSNKANERERATEICG